MRWLLLPVLVLWSACVSAEKLSIERIFGGANLGGPSPNALTIAPDGRHIAFLRGRADDQFQIDLWLHDVKSGKATRLVDSAALSEGKELSDAEKARRERARTAGSKGISSYRWSPDGKRLLFTLDERLWLCDLAAPASKRVRALTPKGMDVLDAKISPRGGFVAFVSKQNLYAIELANGQIRQLTHDGAGAIHNGEAEFVAEEEMGRRTGYWWARDDSAIAFERYDESGVDEVERSEVYPDRTVTLRQRYPAAGRPNVTVKLGVIAPAGGEPRWLDLGANPDIYLTRVDWLPDSKRLAIQRESRDQRRLDLILAAADGSAQTIALSETSDTWINLNNDLRFLRNEDAFVWASERSGYKHLYVFGLDGTLRRTLTRGDWDVDQLLALDEKKGLVYFGAGREDVLQSQVYVTRLDGSQADAPRRISEGEGSHGAVFGEDASVWVDSFSNPTTPPQVSLRKADGKLIAWIERNELKEGHPFWPYRDSLVTPEYGTLKSESGEDLHYRVYKPLGMQAGHKYPVFMNYYGGPGSQFVRKGWGNYFEQYMAANGYVVFSLDNRGSPRRGRHFSDAIFKQLGKPEIADQLKGVAWLKSQPYVDGERIGIFGWSYGGYQTLMLLAKAGKEFAAGVAVAPVTDWTLYDTHYTERFLDTPQNNAEGYEKSGVLHWLDGIESHKLLLVHGMADDNVLFSNSTKLMAALQNKGVQFELMTYPGAKHGLSTPALRKHVYTMITQYFDARLKPAPAAP
ncbi:MAG: S9 family peptidase [Dokdonella sp.]|uniref:S9 family peptidase n=1 Tax=Dokdonella sp. TaxID=2291710 RepID=UPI0025BC63AC|nr:S9 family peptidase [Dokdonella sp.]MBZ0221478.1 S9 family peptidase [Dokdonella sp.]MCC7255037.1 S9 family peptidase [Dokdonella sp.]